MMDDQDFQVGDSVIFCSVPDYDYPRNIFSAHIVAEVWDDGQIILDNGSRTGPGCLWHSLQDIENHLDAIAMLQQIDASIG